MVITTKEKYKSQISSKKSSTTFPTPFHVFLSLYQEETKPPLNEECCQFIHWKSYLFKLIVSILDSVKIEESFA